jgi:tetratricopeptide (TPR) repeat protein
VAVVRLVLIGLAVVLALGLGALQAVASIALRDDARAPSWVLAIPAGFAARVDALDPALPLPQQLRLVLARRALVGGRDQLAAAYVAGLAPSPDRAELSGMLAERRGDAAEALRWYVAAGAVDKIEDRVDALAAAGKTGEALGLQASLVERVRGDPAQAAELPEADYRLGLLEQRVAYTLDISQRGPLQARSLADYERAVALAPQEERYVIAAGNEAINDDDLDKALRYFGRARELDPRSATPVAGFGDIALRRGDRAQALADLRQARALDPAADSVRRLAAKLGE